MTCALYSEELSHVSTMQRAGPALHGNASQSLQPVRCRLNVIYTRRRAAVATESRSLCAILLRAVWVYAARPMRTHWQYIVESTRWVLYFVTCVCKKRCEGVMVGGGYFSRLETGANSLGDGGKVPSSLPYWIPLPKQIRSPPPPQPNAWIGPYLGEKLAMIPLHSPSNIYLNG